MYRDVGKPSPNVQNQRLAAKAILDKLKEEGVQVEDGFPNMETDLEKLEGKNCQCKLSRFDRVRHIFLD